MNRELTALKGEQMLNTKIEKLTIVLENCDCIDIDGKYVCGLDIDKTYTRIALTIKDEVTVFDIADYVAFELSIKANVTHFDLGQRACKTMVFNRLSYPDIVAVEIKLVDQKTGDITEKTFYTAWDSETEYGSNLCQKSSIRENGNLRVVICKPEHAKNY